MNYDPNLTSSGRMAKQLVRLTFQKWGYKAEFTVEVDGNCTGLSVIERAVESALDSYYAPDNIPVDAGHFFIVELKNSEGVVLICAGEGKDGDWLKDMLVKAEITSIDPVA